MKNMIKMLSPQTAINFRLFHRMFFKTLKGQIFTYLITKNKTQKQKTSKFYL